MRDTGRHLADWRRIRGLTTRQVADRAGIGIATLDRIEAGSGATFENILRVARALGILESVIVGFDPSETDVGKLRSLDALPRRVRHPSPPR